MSSQLGQLLRLIGREGNETVSILTQVPGNDGILNVHWTTVADADLVVDSLPGCNVWYGVQPIARPDTGRGKATDITGLVCLYADMDWRRPGKPDGMEPSEALELTAELSDLLGSEPVGIVVSGNGIQPYWRVERVDPEFGRNLLSWWRYQVLTAASEMKVSIDSQVYDLPRILRVPGPDNLKDEENPKPTRLVVKNGRSLSRSELSVLMLNNPIQQSNDYSAFDRRGGDLSPRDGVRLFTPEQAARYIEEHAMAPLRGTPEGAGFNAQLNASAWTISAFVPAFLSEDDAFGLLSDECARRWGSANRQDWSTIESGFRGCDWEAQVTPEEMAKNPFWDFYESAEDLPLAPTRGQKTEVHFNTDGELESNGTETTRVILHGREFEVATAHPKGMPTEGCYLSDEFWSSRAPLGQIRELAWATRSCPESVLLSTFVRVAGNVMPNVKVHGGIGSPAALNTMALLVGPPGSGKSVSWGVATRYVNIVEGANAPVFSPNSGPGLMAMYGSWNKPKGGGRGHFERHSYAAIGFLDETDTISSLREQRGNTLSSVLRSAAMGNALGSQTMDVERRTNLEAGSYAFGLVACGQPLRMGWLLNDDEVAGGLPQRFLWAPAVSLYHPVWSDVPEEMNILVPLEGRPGLSGNPFDSDGVQGPKPEYVVLAPDEVMEQMALRYRQRQMFGGDPMTAHIDLTRLKVAAYLMLLDGRMLMTVEDWELAGEVIRMSVATCQWTYEQLRHQTVKDADARAKSKGKAEATTVMVTEDRLLEAAKERIIQLVGFSGEEGILASETKRSMSPKRREFFDSALEVLIQSGIIRTEPADRGGKRLFAQ